MQDSFSTTCTLIHGRELQLRWAGAFYMNISLNKFEVNHLISLLYYISFIMFITHVCCANHWKLKAGAYVFSLKYQTVIYPVTRDWSMCFCNPSTCSKEEIDSLVFWDIYEHDDWSCSKMLDHDFSCGNFFFSFKNIAHISTPQILFLHYL